MLILKQLKSLMVMLALLLASHPHVNANPAWALRKEKEGIRIYTAKMPNECYKAVRVECFMTARAEQLLALLLDIDNNHEWVYKTKSSRLLKTINAREIIYYAQMESPWPFSNRDIIAHLKIKRESPKVITIESRAQPDFIPEEEDVVRIKSSKAQWTITNVKENLIKVEYVIQFDPGGNIPAWLINLFISDGPMESFKKMKERVNMPDYTSTHFEL